MLGCVCVCVCAPGMCGVHLEGVGGQDAEKFSVLGCGGRCGGKFQELLFFAGFAGGMRKNFFSFRRMALEMGGFLGDSRFALARCGASGGWVSEACSF